MKPCSLTSLQILSFLQAHSSVEKAGLIGLVRLRLLPPDDNLTLHGDTLQKAIDQDRRDGLIPFFVSENTAIDWGYIIINSSKNVCINNL